MPDKFPEVEFIAATDGSNEIHVPEGMASLSVRLFPIQTEEEPVIAEGNGLIVIG